MPNVDECSLERLSVGSGHRSFWETVANEPGGRFQVNEFPRDKLTVQMDKRCSRFPLPHDARSVGFFRDTFAVEWAENRRLRCFSCVACETIVLHPFFATTELPSVGFAVSHRIRRSKRAHVDQSLHSEDIGDEDHLVSLLGRNLPSFDQHLARLQPFARCQLGFNDLERASQRRFEVADVGQH